MNRPAVGWLALATVLFVTSPALPQAGAQNTLRKIDVGGLKLRAQIEGQHVEGQPTVVLVGGLGDGLEIWERVQPAVAQFARVVAYDRAGLGQSDPDNAPPTPQHVATQLHTLLHNAGIKPPYVLVGHSIGGPHVRMFAGLYPGEVAGLVFVDPTDFTQTRADMVALWTELGPGEAGLNAFEKSQAEQFPQQFAGKSPGLRAEAEVAILQLPKTGFEDFRSLPPLPDVPVVILMATQSDMPAPVKLVYGKQRLLHFAKLAVDVPDGLFVMTTRSGHYIHSSEPELVTWAIRRALKK
jgi:pimeloyl-ACP methyl ester carboxylesterase